MGYEHWVASIIGHSGVRQVFSLRASDTLAAAVLTALATLLCNPAAAHLPEYLGRRYVLDGPVPPGLPVPCSGNRQKERVEAEALREQLAVREAAEGPYSVALADPAGELAKRYAGHCNHPAALDQYQSALHKLRISDGLLTPAQLPLLKAMAESYLAIGDVPSAQASMRYAFRVHGMGRGALTAAALEDSLAYFAFARRVFIDPRYAQDIGLFHEALLDNLAMVEAQDERGELDYAAMESLVVSQLYNLYLLLGTDLSLQSMNSRDAGGAAWDFMQRNQILTFGKGMDLLRLLIARSDQESPRVRAALYLRMGNWQQWNDKWQGSCDAYAEAWALALAAGEDGAGLRGVLSRPAELPEEEDLWLTLRDPAIPVKALIEADFRVSGRGRVSGVEARVVDEGNPALAGRVARWLRDSHMRPALSDTGCVDGELRGRRYRLVD